MHKIKNAQPELVFTHSKGSFPISLFLDIGLYCIFDTATLANDVLF